MAGTDDAGKAWATSYDERVKEVLGAVNDLTKALENYGGVVIQAGYNHAVAEHNATPGNQGPAPAMPPQPASTAGVLSAPPSAGGPGRGLVDAIGLMQQVGVPVPDGDTDKVSKAADAWDRLATVYQTKTIAEGLEVDARTFRDTHSPEVEYIVRDLEELRDAMTIRNGRMRRAVAVVQRLQVRARRSAYATRGHPEGSGDRTRGHCGDRHRRVVRLLRCRRRRGDSQGGPVDHQIRAHHLRSRWCVEDLEEHRQRRQEGSGHRRAAREAAANHQYGAQGEADGTSQRQDSGSCPSRSTGTPDTPRSKSRNATAE